MECLDPSPVANGVYSPPIGPYVQDGNVTYTCNYGSVLSAGDAIHYCDLSTWIGEAPTCLGKFYKVYAIKS